MKFNNFFFIFFISCLCIPSFTISKVGKLRILLTSANVNNGYYEFRKQQYIRCLQILSNWGYSDNVYIVEAVAKGPTYLDEYCNHVFYATVNDPSLKNNGINEARTTLEAINHFGFDKDDMILKLTGRYEFLNQDFINLVLKVGKKYHMIGRFEGGGIFTLCYAMKCKYLKEMLETMDYHAMEHGGPAAHNYIISVEAMFGRYVENKKKQGLRTLHVPFLGVKAVLTGSTTMKGFDGVTMTF